MRKMGFQYLIATELAGFGVSIVKICQLLAVGSDGFTTAISCENWNGFGFVNSYFAQEEMRQNRS